MTLVVADENGSGASRYWWYGRGFVSMVLTWCVFGPFFAYWFHLVEGWTAWESYVFTGVVISTVGYGNIVPTTTTGRMLVIICGSFGIPLFLHGMQWLVDVTVQVLNSLHNRLRGKPAGAYLTTREQLCFKGVLMALYFAQCVLVYVATVPVAVVLLHRA